MYIKSIVLDGFKSYGQRTEINGFDEQFNAITGLNGSGKSNILDSICFVLGISNLTHVRAASLQDLIYKSGQAGVNKATVSITFDNSNLSQCPPGFENYKEITITRQIVLGGKNKYMMNGTNVPNKKIQDLFCSIQLNVNNPHFLIMQGKITKVLNMKPPEILAMVEEAAGTRMYEIKRQNAQKLIEKKDAKLQELRAIFNEEIAPKLKKLRQDREQFLEYQQVDRELEKMLALYQCWQFYQSKHYVKNALENLETAQKEIESFQNQIKENIETAQQLDENIKEITANSETEITLKLKELEVKLKEKEKIEAKSNATVKSISDNIHTEEKKVDQLKKNLEEDGRILSNKQQELSKVQSLFETLKTNDTEDNAAFILSQKKFEAVSAGMEVNEDGEAQTLQDQFMKAKEDAMKAVTESKQASMQLTSCKNQLNQKRKELGSNSTDYDRDKALLEKKQKEVEALQANISKLNYSEEKMGELQSQRRILTQEIRNLKEKIDNFYVRKPYAKFSYSNPEPNFNRRSVKGVVCNLIKCGDTNACMALETAAGGKLFNVVVDTEATGKKLLKGGNLQLRTTFIPLNKIRASTLDSNTIQFAQKLVGAENCRPALSLIKYDRELQAAMEFVFSSVFICKDLNVAKQVAFHNKIKKKCVTLDGDVIDPSGILSGGAPVKGGSMLLQLWDIQKQEQILADKERELDRIIAEMQQLSNIQENYNALKQKLAISEQELNFVNQKLLHTTHHIQQEEIANLENQIETLQQKVATCKEIELKASQKAKELEMKMKDTKGYREKQLKEAEMEMKRMKQKAEKSRKEWKQREQEYETLNLEISELKTGLENTKTQVETTEKTIAELKAKLDEMSGDATEIKEEVKNLQNQVKKIKSTITENNKDIQKKTQQKEKLLALNDELKLKIKEHNHDLKKLEDNCKNAKLKEQEYAKRIKGNNPNIQRAEELSAKEGNELEGRIKSYQEKKQKLSRIVNTKAQSMFEQEEKQYNDCRKKERIVEQDKKKILDTLKDMDKQKENSLKLAYEQVSKDFGSIFSTLLPGANARLVAPMGKTILEGLEVKVSLGGVWKESLTELSGGQRSLAALSLILAMLLFKPAPLYILDEVDAALDLSHTQNIGNMLKSHFKKSQFIIVSLKDGMFNNANVLFRTKFVDGVSMITRTVNYNK
ncbi:structural maintenance of chromosomes protein 2 [Diorhabda sublineata]|uniref:structural maintenance of chromosomes protein 2 n=1 Tax=Diorhabda sublineata TaxID=1163346 RepID=UPI0024E0F3EC|nr:structural maintenance of chromosomes protein 2 [Diorhabda sublineata]